MPPWCLPWWLPGASPGASLVLLFPAASPAASPDAYLVPPVESLERELFKGVCRYLSVSRRGTVPFIVLTDCAPLAGVAIEGRRAWPYYLILRHLAGAGKI